MFEAGVENLEPGSSFYSGCLHLAGGDSLRLMINPAGATRCVALNRYRIDDNPLKTNQTRQRLAPTSI
jgi:hypothetical protein